MHTLMHTGGNTRAEGEQQHFLSLEDKNEREFLKQMKMKLFKVSRIPSSLVSVGLSNYLRMTQEIRNIRTKKFQLYLNCLHFMTFLLYCCLYAFVLQICQNHSKDPIVQDLLCAKLIVWHWPGMRLLKSLKVRCCLEEYFLDLEGRDGAVEEEQEQRGCGERGKLK